MRYCIILSRNVIIDKINGISIIIIQSNTVMGYKYQYSQYRLIYCNHTTVWYKNRMRSYRLCNLGIKGIPLCDACLLVWQKHWRTKTIKMMQPQLSARLTTAFRGLTMGFSTRTKPQLKAKKQSFAVSRKHNRGDILKKYSQPK